MVILTWFVEKSDVLVERFEETLCRVAPRNPYKSCLEALSLIPTSFLTVDCQENVLDLKQHFDFVADYIFLPWVIG